MRTSFDVLRMPLEAGHSILPLSVAIVSYMAQFQPFQRKTRTKTNPIQKGNEN